MLPVLSAIYPISNGATAPPTTVITSNEDANLVCVPASLNAKEKIVGNIMLSPKYKAKNATSEIVPLNATTTNVATQVSNAHARRTHLGRMKFISTLPANRPTKNKPMPPKAKNMLAVSFSI